MPSESILVLGAGVIGLTTAISLQEAGYIVDIWARELSPHTTSDKAAAYWYPFHVYPANRVKKWSHDALKFWQENILTDPRSGVIPGRYLKLEVKEEADPDFVDGVQGFRRATADELPKGYSHGFFLDTVVMNPDITMPFLVRKFRSLGGRLQQKTVKDIAEAFVWYDCVINCTGLGARELCHDKTVFAARGQTVIIRQSEAMPLILNDESGPNHLGYIVPRQMDIVLGGTFQPDNESLLVSEKDTKEILERCAGMVGPGHKVEILAEKVGLRPCRPEVRLETEFFAEGRKLVVHNYGHGGAGWTLSWGCAKEVVDLVIHNLNKAKLRQRKARL